MAKKYRVTVDGTSYEVEVEELGGSSAPASSSPATVTAAAPAPAAAPAASPAPKPAAAPAPTGPVEGTEISAPMPGKVLRVAVQSGAAVNAGDLLLVLEAMKMENEILAPAGGTVKEVRAHDGDSVNTGDLLLVIG